MEEELYFEPEEHHFLTALVFSFWDRSELNLDMIWRDYVVTLIACDHFDIPLTSEYSVGMIRNASHSFLDIPSYDDFKKFVQEYCGLNGVAAHALMVGHSDDYIKKTYEDREGWYFPK